MIPFALPDIGEEEVAGVTECLRSGWLTSGKKVQQFEQEFANYVGAPHAIAVNSATMAALLLLEAVGVGPGDEVIIPAYTFSGPAMMAHKLGAKIVLADCLPNSYQIDPTDVARKLTMQTRVIMPTHFGGAACNISQLQRLAKQAGVILIDDAAHAFPTVDPVTRNFIGEGSISDATFFSFYATKTLTTGEGGMITTRDPTLAAALRSRRTHGFSRNVFDRYTNVRTGWQYDISQAGWKANLTDIAAAIGLAQLKRAGTMTERRARIAGTYLKHLRGVGLPHASVHSAWHLFPIQVRDREAFIDAMGCNGVQCSVHFIPLHLHSEWGRIVGKSKLPNAEDMYLSEVSLPLYSSMTDDQVVQVIEAVNTSASVS